MENIIITAVLLLVIGFAVFYIYKIRKNGKGCIGCPYSHSCNKGKCRTYNSSCDK